MIAGEQKLLPDWYTYKRTGTKHRIYENGESVCGLKASRDGWVQQLGFPWEADRKCKVCKARVGDQ